MQRYFQLVLFLLIQSVAFGQDGRIDTLVTADGQIAYYLRNAIDEEKVWTTELTAARYLPTGTEISISDTLVEVEHAYHDPLYLEIEDGKPHRFTVDASTKVRYYLSTTTNVRLRDTRKRWLECIYTNVRYPKKAIKQKVAGMAVIQLYIDSEGCIRATRALSDLGTGLEHAAIRAMQACDCSLVPAYRDGAAVPSLFIAPMRFRLE